LRRLHDLISLLVERNQQGIVPRPLHRRTRFKLGYGPFQAGNLVDQKACSLHRGALSIEAVGPGRIGGSDVQTGRSIGSTSSNSALVFFLAKFDGPLFKLLGQSHGSRFGEGEALLCLLEEVRRVSHAKHRVSKAEAHSLSVAGSSHYRAAIVDRRFASNRGQFVTKGEAFNHKHLITEHVSSGGFLMLLSDVREPTCTRSASSVIILSFRGAPFAAAMAFSQQG
jgi:hypothetical protein